MKEVIILGGGFAGVSAALHLKKKEENDLNITLIDKNSYHLFHASLYEVATSEQPKKNIAIPFSEVLGNKIKFVKGEVVNIDTDNHLIHLSDETNYSYDYLIVALGSESAFFGIEGLKEYSIPLKELEDAVSIREAIEKAFHEKVHEGKEINVVVGGGGFSGTELTAELTNYRTHLSNHHKTSPDLFKISVIQGSPSLLKELDEKVSEIALKRLEQENVQVCLGAHIKKVTKEEVETDDGKKYPYDVLIWTGGVKANKILNESGFKVNGRDQITVNTNLQINNFNNIFAVGDISEFAEPITNKPAPGVAEVAIDQGRVAAENVYRSFKNIELLSYEYKHLGYIIPIKGHFAVADLNKIRLVGFLGWIVQQIVFLDYLLKILPLSKALRRWNKAEMYLIKS